jgi:TrmH family RNA methyltransferase
MLSRPADSRRRAPRIRGTPMRAITSRRNEIVTRFRELARDRAAQPSHLLLDGAHLVAEARAAGARLEHVAVAASRLDADTEERRLAQALDREGVDVVAAPDAVFAAMSPVRTPSGIAAIAGHTAAEPAAICESRNALVLAAVDVQDPGNIGALVRVAEAGGVTGVLVCSAPGRAAASPFAWKALRGSMGSALRLPVAAGLSADAALDLATRTGLATVATVARGGLDPDAVEWRRRMCLILGGEGPGLPAGVIERCDAHVTIPMAAGVESLNVAVAGGILIYAARRQRMRLDGERTRPEETRRT